MVQLSKLMAASIVILSNVCHALDNGLAKTPPMGYNTWYDYTGTFTEADLRQCVDAFVKLNLKSYGYTYWNLDDLWVAPSRYPNGSFYADPAKFPSKTLRPLADYVHSKGLLFGAYTDRGTKQCGPGVGSLDHEDIDAQTFAEWQIDYLKEDSCAASGDHDTAFQEYGKMRDALNKTGRPIVFSLCGWNPWYAPEGYSLGNLWRIGPDDNNWPGVLTNIDINSQLSQYAGPGGWNDPCLLLAEDFHGHQRMTELQSRAQFSMWAIMASPLIISANIRNMSAANIETYTNREVIAVDQDKLGIQGKRIVGTNLRDGGGDPSRWLAATAQPCSTSDPQQKWQYETTGQGNRRGTLLNPPSNQYLNVLDCGNKLGLWEWVTTGCDNNQGFNFSFADGSNFKSTLRAADNCVQDNGPGSQLTLAECNGDIAQRWTITSSGHVQSESGHCLSTKQPDHGAPGVNIWARSLVNNATAFVFINAGADTVPSLVCDAACLQAAGINSKYVHLRDLWAHKDLGIYPATNITVHDLQADGGHTMLLASPRESM